MSKPVLFSCFRPIERSENLRAIYEAYDGEKKLIYSYDPNYHDEVTSGNYDLMVIDDFPACTPGKCIVIGHSIHGGKTIGLDQPGRPYYDRTVADRITYIISAGYGAVGMWESCSGVPRDRILPLGFPRSDQYIGKHKGDGHTVLAGKRAYLYAPTFRDKGETPLPDVDWDYIDSHLSDDEVFAVKVHPWYYQYVSQSWVGKQYKHIIELSGFEPSTPYLYDSDVVITDYSSIMFDAYLLNKPVVLFEKTAGYTETRGMYLKYPWKYSSRWAFNEHLLVHTLQHCEPTLHLIEVDCKLQLADMCDGHACERLCNLIRSEVSK